MAFDTVEEERELRRRLLMHVVQHMNENVVHVAGDALVDILTDASEDCISDFLGPILNWGYFWPVQIAMAALDLPNDHDYEIRDVVEEFDRLLESEGNEDADGSQADLV